MTLPLALYRGFSALALPFAARRQRAQIRAAGFSDERGQERLGYPSLPRPPGQLIWLHGASVGEAKSVLPLAAQLQNGGVQVLLTSGTASAAQVIAGQLPKGVIHQFSPLDGRRAVARFLDHWQPDLTALVESELWPNLLMACIARKIPVALLNARMSDRSAARWAQFPRTARKLLSGVFMAHCQDTRTRDHLRAMGLSCAASGVNLKSFQPAANFCKTELQTLQNRLGARPVWVAASTHSGEEEPVLAAHQTLLTTHPELLLILVPRHPERRAEIQHLLEKTDLRFDTRSTGAQPESDQQVYLADTLGEAAIWYTLARIVFLGGSFVPVGGHTPFEPAAAGCAILHGPHYDNFTEVFAMFQDAKASWQVSDSAALTQAIETLLSDPAPVQSLSDAAHTLVAANVDALDGITRDLLDRISA